jgi:hypothetical protein
MNGAQGRQDFEPCYSRYRRGARFGRTQTILDERCPLTGRLARRRRFDAGRGASALAQRHEADDHGDHDRADCERSTSGRTASALSEDLNRISPFAN